MMTILVVFSVAAYGTLLLTALFLSRRAKRLEKKQWSYLLTSQSLRRTGQREDTLRAEWLEMQLGYIVHGPPIQSVDYVRGDEKEPSEMSMSEYLEFRRPQPF
jgi:hypothetical protein